MHLEGQFTVAAPQADVYRFLTEPAKVGRHLPDVTDVVIADADHFTVTARVGVSHIKGTMVVKLEIRDRQPPVSTTLVGKGSGLGSVVDMVTSFTLAHSVTLALASLENAFRLGPAAALTGPVARGDLQTIEKHIAEMAPAERDAYRALAREAARLVEKRDSALSRLLGDVLGAERTTDGGAASAGD